MAHAFVGFPVLAAFANAILASRLVAIVIATAWALAVLFVGPAGIEEEAGIVI